MFTRIGLSPSCEVPARATTAQELLRFFAAMCSRLFGVTATARRHDGIQRAVFSICRTPNVLTATSRREGLVTMHTSRRIALIGLCAGAAQLLFTKRLIAGGAIHSSESTATPGS